jgi:hypothetical protein
VSKSNIQSFSKIFLQIILAQKQLQYLIIEPKLESWRKISGYLQGNVDNRQQDLKNQIAEENIGENIG